MYVIDYKIPQQLNGVSSKIEDMYWRGKGEKGTPAKRLSVLNAIKCIILNVHNQRKYSKNKKIIISLDEAKYSLKRIVNGRSTGRKVSYTSTKEVLDFLVNNNLIKLIVGGRREGGKTGWGFNVQERIFSDKKWIPVKVEYSVLVVLPLLEVLLPEYQPHEIDNVMVLKVKKGKGSRESTYRFTNWNREPYHFQREYNKFSLKRDVMLDGYKRDVQSYKVFNNNFNQGGRSYMSEYMNIQQLTKAERKMVEIDGKETAILDYTAFEVTILYTLLQEVIEDDDPYEIEVDGYNKELLRKISKGLLLRMINTESPSDAYRAANNFIREEFDVQKLYDDHLIPEDRVCVKHMLELLEDKHSQVMHKFYEGIGGQLQYYGSLITDYILEYFMQRGILVIQVHDEYIIQEESVDELHSVMKKAFTKVLGFDENVRIKREK